MENLDDIRDDEIRFIGREECYPNEKSNFLLRYWKWICAGLVLIGIIIGITLAVRPTPSQEEQIEPSYFEPTTVSATPQDSTPIGKVVDAFQEGYCELKDTIINDIPIRLFFPHNASMSLHIGKVNKKDTNIIYVAQAADIRADNGGIVGAFVLKGTPKAWGLSKKGYCAYINGQTYVGVADNSPLFEMATEQGGYFFRQYPLVKDGKLVESELKGKSIRRGICDRFGEIFMVETLTKESFHDFSQALADMGVEQAIYLVGSTAYGWAVDEEGTRHEFGDDAYYTGKRKMPRNTNYIIWRKQ